MATLRDIQRRIKSVKNTQQITKAMKMVAAAKLRRAQDDIIAARPYADKLTELTESLSESVTPESNPFFRQPEEVKKVEVVVMTSDRGLCGGFNAQLIRATDKFIAEHPDMEIGLTLIGKRAFEHYKSRPTPILSSRAIGSTRPELSLARELTQNAVQAYTEGRVDAIYLIYSEFKSALTQETVVKQLLPIASSAAAEETTDEYDADSVEEAEEDTYEEDNLEEEEAEQESPEEARWAKEDEEWAKGDEDWTEEDEEWARKDKEWAEEYGQAKKYSYKQVLMAPLAFSRGLKRVGRSSLVKLKSLRRPAGQSPEEKYLFEPSKEGLLESILPKYLEVQVFRTLLETSASEHGARMTAMDAASRSASDMISSLSLIYNRARQAAITTELMEIIGGAEALKG